MEDGHIKYFTPAAIDVDKGQALEHRTG